MVLIEEEGFVVRCNDKCVIIIVVVIATNGEPPTP